MCEEIYLEMDEMRVQQILLNLLTNAIKFSHSDNLVQVVVKTVTGNN